MTEQSKPEEVKPIAESAETSSTEQPKRRNPMQIHEDFVTDDAISEAIAEGGGISLCLENVPHSTGSLEDEVATYIRDSKSLQTLELRHCQLFSLSNFVSSSCTAPLELIDLRQNILEGLRDFNGCGFASTLHKLDVSDNRLSSLRGIDGLEALTVFDASYNVIGHVSTHLSGLTRLEELYLEENRLRTTDWVAPLRNLRVLELGANKITQIDSSIAQLGQLECLWLGRNKIASLDCFSTPSPMATSLKKLSLQLNRIEAVPLGSLDGLISITELYLSENGITTLAGVASLKSLRILDVAQNRLADLTGVETLINLEEFWCNDNRVEDWEQVRKLQNSPKIVTVYFEANPIASNIDYRTRLHTLLPTLTQIDAHLVK